MNLKRNLVASAISVAALALSGGAAADEEVTLYGLINVSYQQTDAEFDGNEIRSNTSFFGIQGKSKISDGLKAIYTLEWEVDTADSNTPGQDTLRRRTQFVGLGGDFGEVIIGRVDLPMKIADRKIDLFNNLEGELNLLMLGDNRTDNTFQYTSPKFAGGFQVKYAETTRGLGQAETNGVTVGSGSTVSLEYTSKNLFFALTQDSNIDGLDSSTIQLSTQYRLNNWKFGLIYNENDAVDLLGNGQLTDEEGTMFNVAYQWDDHTIKLQTVDSDQKGVDRGSVSIGWDMKLARDTYFYAFQTSRDAVDPLAANPDQSFFGIGLQHIF
ncbi:MAG: porin [Kangiellaceae bacterium]|jgi:predicted porin|nr:porin [Kangiellaceae bacterium]